MKNLKGQSDTFKLLIAAVVAMAILAIVGTVLQSIEVKTCVEANPIEELTTTISRAQSGLDASTGIICIKEGESFSADAVTAKVTAIPEGALTFSCLGDSAVCTGTSSMINVESDRVTARSDTEFQALIKCNARGDGTGNYDCTAEIKSAAQP